MDYLEKLRRSAEKIGSIVCMGLDPVPEAMSELKLDYWFKAEAFFEDILKEMKTQGVSPGAFKPNQGYYLRMDKPREGNFMGSRALANIMDLLDSEFPGIPIILDFKKGDVKKSSENYAVEGFDNWKADAVTVFPYMGTDSVSPFTDYCDKNAGRGVYILNRTSNEGAKDVQDLPLNTRDSGLDTLVYQQVAKKIVDWAKDRPGVGAVVGATSKEELSDLAKFYAGKDIPLLIPNVGGQGGRADDVTAILRDSEYDLSLARVNSSSGLTHPWKKAPAPRDYAKVCVAELNKLNEQIGYKP